MRIPAMIVAALVISTTSAVWAQGWVAPPTRVCEIGLYACPDHPQFQATWPARCPICGMVLIAAPGGAGSAAGAVGGRAATGRGSTSARTQSPGMTGRAEGGRSQQFGLTPEQQFRQQFPLTPEQQFRQRFPETPEQQFRRQFPETPEQQFGQRFPETPEQQFGQGFRNEEFGEQGFRNEEFGGPESPNEGFSTEEFGSPRP